MMNNKILLLLIFSLSFLCVNHVHAQDSLPTKKYQSLLWKITGNGLKKPSYLYGTMHVSKKVAYRLDDVFYKALFSADAVAVESTPDTWIKYLNTSPEFRSSLAQKNIIQGRGFYRKGFEMKSPEVFEINQLLGSQDYFLNAILYRMENQRNLEEDTYLDMFIYQAGKKFHKPAYSLENVDESNYLVSKAQIFSIKTKPSVWLQKKLEDKNYNNFLEDTYRKRDLDVLDSIMKGGYTQHNLMYMLWVRNRHMMKTLDSLMQKGESIFAGIGAAHLPGDKGAIELLRKMGYTVEPYTSAITSTAKQAREKIESTFVKEEYHNYTSEDGFISLKAPREFTEINLGNYRVNISPDLTNGSYVILTRIHLFNPLNKEGQITYETLKNMVYEATHGKIESQTETTINGFPAIEIRNKTKEKDDQRYLYIYTPLELVVIKMGGKRDFVSRYGDEVFNSIKLHPKDNSYKTITPGHKEYELKVPTFYVFDNANHWGRRIVEAIDREDDTYYFMIEQMLPDVDYLEEDQFELSQIQRRFFEEIDLEVPQGEYSQTGDPTYLSVAEFDKDTQDSLYLFTRLRANHYFLLGMKGKKRQKAFNYFDSFHIHTPHYDKEFKQVQDTSLYFNVKSLITPPDTYMNYYSNREKTEKDKPYMGFTRDNTYISDANESITVNFRKYNDYSWYENIDSLWKATLDYYRNDLSLIVKNKKTATDPNGYPYLDVKFTDTLTGRIIWLKKILAKDKKYSLRTVLDSTHSPSKYITQFYETFTPYDTLFGKDLLEDKLSGFLQALEKNDSLVFDTYRYLEIRQKHLPRLKKFLTSFHFPKDKQKIRNYLLQNMAEYVPEKDKSTIMFLDSLYIASYDNSYSQLSILTGYALNSHNNFDNKIINLLDKDLPLTADNSEIISLFNILEDKPGNAKSMFPELLNYTTVNEYKNPIYDLLGVLKDSGYVNKKHYKKFRRQLLTEAKINLKKVMSETYSDDDNSYYSSDNNLNSKRMQNYLNLLYPFRKDKNINAFISQLHKVDDNLVREKLITLQIANNEPYSHMLMDSVAKDLKTRWLLYKDLKKIGKTNRFPSRFAKQQFIAESLLFSDENIYNKKTDTIVFMEKHPLKIHNKDYIAYIFKTKKIKNNYMGDANNWIMHAAAFKKEDMDPISVKDYIYSVEVEIKDTKPIDKQIKGILERLKWYDRKRVSFDDNSFYY